MKSFVKDALAKAGLDPSKHMIAVTSETSPLAKSDDYLAAFFMDDYIGGRYSSIFCSWWSCLIPGIWTRSLCTSSWMVQQKKINLLQTKTS